MLQFIRKGGKAAFCGAALLAVANLAGAQQPVSPPAFLASPNATEERPAFPIAPLPNVARPASPVAVPPSVADQDDLRARIERLERQNEELIRALQGTQGRTVSTGDGDSVNKDDVQKIVGDYLKTRDDQVKAVEVTKQKDAEAKGYTVGQSLGMTAKWNNGLWLESADKAFRFHVGGRTQFDVAVVTAPDDVMFGRGGIGDYQDGVHFRRGRFAMEGSMWEVIDFNMEWDFINTTNVDPTGGATPGNVINTPVPTDLWVQLTHLPWIGHFRVGNQKPWIGFEHLTSSRFLNFMERSYQFDSYLEEGNNGFSPGFSIWDNFGADDRAWYGLSLNKTTRSIFGYNIGDGEWSTTGRLAYLPVWEDNGRSLVHVGVAGSFKDLDDDVARFRSRTLIRNGPAALHNIAAVAQVRGRNETLVNPELVAQAGPFLIQSEYIGAWISGTDTIIRTPIGNNLNQKISPRTYFTQGFYVEALYFLTGEHRAYNKKNMSFDRVIPHRNYFWVPGECGSNCFSGGAWQVGARYSYLDLNNADIGGGQLNSFTAGLNWFLNPNLKVQWNYELGFRQVPTGTSDGTYQGAGMRVALDW